MRKAILDKIRELEDWKSRPTGGYWREQLEFLRIYTASGVEAKLMRHALNKLNVKPLNILEDIDGFFDSSAYICSSKELVFVKVRDDMRKHIRTFNFGEYRLQFPVPNEKGKFDSHNLVIYRKTDAQRLVITYLDDKHVKAQLFEFK